MIRFGDLYGEKPKEAENKALVLAEDVLSEASCSSQNFLQIIQSFKGKKKKMQDLILTLFLPRSLRVIWFT